MTKLACECACRAKRPRNRWQAHVPDLLSNPPPLFTPTLPLSLAEFQARPADPHVSGHTTRPAVTNSKKPRAKEMPPSVAAADPVVRCRDGTVNHPKRARAVSNKRVAVRMPVHRPSLSQQQHVQAVRLAVQTTCAMLSNSVISKMEQSLAEQAAQTADNAAQQPNETPTAAHDPTKLRIPVVEELTGLFKHLGLDATDWVLTLCNLYDPNKNFSFAARDDFYKALYIANPANPLLMEDFFNQNHDLSQDVPQPDPEHPLFADVVGHNLQVTLARARHLNDSADQLLAVEAVRQRQMKLSIDVLRLMQDKPLLYEWDSNDLVKIRLVADTAESHHIDDRTHMDRQSLSISTGVAVRWTDEIR